MQRNPHSYQIATGYRTFYSLSLIYQPITKKTIVFLQKTTERERYSAFRSFLLLADYLCQILKYFLEAFQEFLCFIHAEAQRRQQAKYIRTAYTGEYMLLFQ